MAPVHAVSIPVSDPQRNWGWEEYCSVRTRLWGDGAGMPVTDAGDRHSTPRSGTYSHAERKTQVKHS